MKTPANLAEMAHEETGQWLDRDLLETWVVRRFNRLEQKIRNLESEHEAKVIQNVHLMRERDAYRTAEEHQIALRQKMEADRDALAAHVESLAHEIEGALRIKDLWLPAHCEPEHEGECQALAMMHSAFARAAVETPETSLARRDALKQAEALQALLNIIPGGVDGGGCDFGCGKEASMLRDHYRRQAEANQ